MIKKLCINTTKGDFKLTKHLTYFAISIYKAKFIRSYTLLSWFTGNVVVWVGVIKYVSSMYVSVFTGKHKTLSFMGNSFLHTLNITMKNSRPMTYDHRPCSPPTSAVWILITLKERGWIRWLLLWDGAIMTFRWRPISPQHYNIWIVLPKAHSPR